MAAAWVATLACGCAESGDSYLAAHIARQNAAQEETRRRAHEEALRAVQAAEAESAKKQEANRQERDLRIQAALAARRQAITQRATPPSAQPTPSACAENLNFKSCDGSSDESNCKESCREAISASVDKLVASAVDSCLNLYTAETPPPAPGPTCHLTLPAGADPKGDGSGVSEESLAKGNDECTKLCRSEGAKLLASAKERDRAAKIGSALMLAYKRCMLTVDGTREAARYRLHDADLYRDLMQKTDARCRAAHQCDWLEEHSDDYACNYGN